MAKYMWLMNIILFITFETQGHQILFTDIEHSPPSGFFTGIHFPTFNIPTSSHAYCKASHKKCIEKARIWIQQLQHQEILIRACSNSTVYEVAEFFEQGRSQGLFSDQQLLSWYPLYQAPSYCIYIKSLPGYQEHITRLYREMSGTQKTRKKTAKVMDLSVDGAQKLVNHLWSDLQKDLATRQVYEQSQKEVPEILRQQLAMWETIKISQQEIQRTQKSILAHCITDWKVQAGLSNAVTALRYNRRLEAANSDNWHERSYLMSSQLRQLLTGQHMAPDSYTKLYGNQLQHALHGEFISIIDHVARSDHENISVHFIQKLNSHAVECADIGCAYNKEGAVAYASMIADVAWNILDLTCAVGEAIHDATLNTIDLVVHPLETLYTISRSIYSFGVSTGDGLLYQDSDYQYIPESMPTTCKNYEALGQALCTTAQEMKARDWVKGIVCFATECALQARLFKALTSVCKEAGKYALAHAQRITSPILEVNIAAAGIEGATTGIELGQTIARTAAQEEKLFNLIKQVDGTYRSPGGLIYGPDNQFGNRAFHVLEHTKEIIGKTKHSVFNITGEELFLLIDEAWAQKGLPVLGNSKAYDIILNKVIGTQGEIAIRIVAVPGTTQVITAYPIKV